MLHRGVDPNVDSGLHLHEVGEARYEPQRREARRGRQRQYFAALRRADAHHRLAQPGERIAHGIGKATPVVGEIERAVPAMEQRHAEVILERLDLTADRGLREEALGGGLGERKMPRGGVEGEQQIERRQPGGVFLHACAECQEFRDIV